MKTLKMLGMAVIAVLMCLGLGSCTKGSNIYKSLEGTTWVATFPDEEEWVELEFLSETLVVMVCYDYDGIVNIRLKGSYTYENPIVDFSIICDGFCNDFRTKMVDKQMFVTWVDEDSELDMEGLIFKLK